MVKNTDPLVSVCCITFNHEKFIRDAIDGFLMQKTDFPIEIIIRDDASTDATAEIVRDYQSKHPEIIHTIMHTQNQYTLGKRAFPEVFKMARGKYIALCEGDDYWTDPLKLQKQVDFLKSYPECSSCFHKAAILNTDNRFSQINKPSNYKKKFANIYQILSETSIFATCSMLVISDAIVDLPEWFRKMKMGDWGLTVISALKGKIGYIDEVMSVYREHSGGVWTSRSQVEKFQALLDVREIVEANIGPRFKPSLAKGISKILLGLASAHAENEDFLHSKEIFKKSVKKSPANVISQKTDYLTLFVRLYLPKVYCLIKKIKINRFLPEL